jgi:hypothetical protein
MFDRAVQASEAMKQAVQQARVLLIPARSTCRACTTVQMIAAPVLGQCRHCGAELVPLEERDPRIPDSPWLSAA